MVEAFFSTSTWENAVPKLLSAASELRSGEAREAFARLVRDVGRNDASHQVLARYADFLGMVANGDNPGLSRFFRGQPPKLTKAHLNRLSCVDGPISARKFRSEASEVWLSLLREQWVRGDAFWNLLFGSADIIENTSPSESPPIAKTTLVITHEGIHRRICKIIPLSDGGFSVTAPYHNARSGLLVKMPVSDRAGTYAIPADLMTPFSASDRVKLSYHPDGFVQFSGENSSKIRSGRDGTTGQPRGLGLLSQPLRSPIQSGPSVCCTAWGLDDFESWSTRAAEHAVIFCADDEYSEEIDENDVVMKTDGVKGWALSVFVFPSACVEAAVLNFKTGDTLSMLLPMNVYHRADPFRVRLIRISSEHCLGVIAKRESFHFGSESGFGLCGPGDDKFVMNAVYPRTNFATPCQSLDYISTPPVD